MGQIPQGALVEQALVPAAGGLDVAAGEQGLGLAPQVGPRAGIRGDGEVPNRSPRRPVQHRGVALGPDPDPGGVGARARGHPQPCVAVAHRDPGPRPAEGEEAHLEGPVEGDEGPCHRTGRGLHVEPHHVAPGGDVDRRRRG